MKKNIRYFSFTILLMLASAIYAGDLKVSVSPDNISVGDVVSLSLSADKMPPSISEFPKVDGITWLNSVKQGSFGAKAQTVYSFKVTKEGKITIPPIKVQLASKKVVTESIELQVAANRFVVKDGNGKNANIDLNDLFFCKAAILTDRKEFYIGEEIPLEFRIYRANNINPVISYPEIEAGNAIFKDYSNENRENNKFEPVRKTVEKLNGRVFEIYSFRTEIKPLSHGKLDIIIKDDCAVRVPAQGNDRRRAASPFDDDFIDSFMGFSNYKEIPHPLSAEIKNIEIKALPELTGNSVFLGLVGTWKTKFKLSSEKVKTGEPLTLDVEITGQGSPENLKAPPLSLADFRVYPPEIEKVQLSGINQHKINIKYVLIPLKEGDAEISLDFTAFNVNEKKYDTAEFMKKFSVAKGEFVSSTSDKQVFVDSAKQNPEIQPEKTEKARSTIFYLKRCTSEGIAIPLWKNNFMFLLLLLLLPPLIWGVWEITLYRRNRLNADPEYKRRLAAMAFKNTLLKKIKKSKDDELDEVLSTDLQKYLIDMHLLPLGTTASELAAKVNDKDIAECLKHLGANAYMPGVVSMDKKELREKIYNAVKKYTLMFILFMLPFSGYSAVANSGSNSVKATQDSALTLYDEGKFDNAMEYYKSVYNPEQPDPKLLYNIANCLCQKGELPKALAYYEKAHRLAPRDSDIVENMNFVKRKLGLPESCTIANPRELVKYLCGILRPDQWLLVAAAGWALISVALILRHYIKGSKWMSLAALGGLIIAVAIGISIYEYNTKYNSDNAVIIAKRPLVYALPSEKANTTEARLSAGDNVKIEELRSDWTRIRAEGISGWIKSSELSRIWGDWKKLP